MKKHAKQQSREKKDRNDGAREGVQPDNEPAQEIADDEVEIGKTGGKPGTKNTA